MNRRDFFGHSAIVSIGVWGMERSIHKVIGMPIETEPNQKLGVASASRWIRPEEHEKRPVWGIRGGIQVSLWPAGVEGPGDGGPRGLLRIGYPILDGGRGVGLVNFIAIEPVVSGQRGFSELERSDTDKQPGRVFWTGETAQPGGVPHPGTVRTVDGVERLSVRMHTERFDNGAQAIVDIEIRADRPGELQLTTSSAPGSAKMDYCTLTATMGNYARLRLLSLRDGVMEAGRVWPDFTGNEFTADAFAPQDRFVHMPDGDLVVCATSNETDPHSVPPDPVGPGWAYRGSFPLTQYWRKPKAQSDDPSLKVRVNGRRVYWATHNPIPGGLAYENFDLVQRFNEGQVFVFGLTRQTPDEVAHGRIQSS